MKIKRYIACDMKEACELIKRDLGAEAVIVSSRKIRDKGFIGFFKPYKMEVTAALDDMPESSLRNELLQIKEMLLQKGVIDNRNKKEEHVRLQTLLDNMRKYLNQIEVRPELADYIIKGIDDKKASLTPGTAREILAREIELIFTPVIRNHGSNIIAVVGPTGVGKTTTLVKLGAIFSLFERLKISFITLDSYRIGAIEQMKIYGDIIGAPVEVATTPGELQTAVEKNRDKDIILIDTAGRSSRNVYSIAELKSFLDIIKPRDVYLALSCATREQEMLKILNNFKALDYCGLIFTKLDETEVLGGALNAAYLTKLPIVYVTNGQDVPNDIEVASPKLLADLIMKDASFL